MYVCMYIYIYILYIYIYIFIYIYIGEDLEFIIHVFTGVYGVIQLDHKIYIKC